MKYYFLLLCLLSNASAMNEDRDDQPYFPTSTLASPTFSESYAPSSSSSEAVEGLPTSQSLMSYGGEKGDLIYQEEAKKNITLLKKMFSFYRTNPSMVKEGTLRGLISHLAQKRQTIAKATGSANAKHYGVFRLEHVGEHETTPLFLPKYADMQKHIQKTIHEHLKQGRINEWIEMGNTRYRVRVLEKADWPVCVSSKECQLHQSLLRSPRPINELEKQAINRALDGAFLSEFLFDGNVSLTNEGQQVSYQEQLIKICRDVAASKIPHHSGSPSSVIPDEKPLKPAKRLNSKKKPVRKASLKNALKASSTNLSETAAPSLMSINFDKIKKCPFPQISLDDTGSIRLIRVDIEHNLSGSEFTPGYGFMGMIPSLEHLEHGKIPLMICHPGKVYLSPFVSHYENLLKDALFADSQNTDVMRDKIGLFQRYWTIALPLIRGVAAVGEQITEGLYQSHACPVEYDKTIAPSVDNVSYMYWSDEAFLEAYRKMVTFAPTIPS